MNKEKIIFWTKEKKDDAKVIKFNFGNTLISELFDKAQIVCGVDENAFKCVQLSHIDWDGYSCVGLFRNVIEGHSIARTTNTGYSNVGKNFMSNLDFIKKAQFGIYLITDVSFSEPLWEQLMVQSALYPNIEFVYIDHHETSQKSFNTIFQDGATNHINHPNVHVYIDSNLNSATELFARHLYDNGFINGTTMSLASLVSVWDVQLSQNEKYKDAADFNQVLLFFNNIERNNIAMGKAFGYTEASPAIYDNISDVVHDILMSFSKDVTKEDVLGVSKNKNELVFRKVEEFIAHSKNDKTVNGLMYSLPGVMNFCKTIKAMYPDINIEKEVLIVPSLENTLTTMSMLVFGKYEYNIIVEYSMLGDKIVLGCRSRKDSYMINKVCEQFKGGGHPNAAGCSLSFAGYPLSSK